MRKLLVITATWALTILAFANVAAACANWGYQPEVPSKLMK